MTFDEQTEELVFRNGRRLYARGGVISLSIDRSKHELFQGFEGGYEFGYLSEQQETPLTLAERKELADAMSARWKLWGQSVKPYRPSENRPNPRWKARMARGKRPR